jgi:deazaflavin-dependent oxidoreductase (nitroreductase family)
VTGGRFGLRDETTRRFGMLRLTTTGRRTGQERWSILGFLPDGPDLVLVAMNGWADPAPAWFLNLQAHPDAAVDLPGGSRREVVARAATEDERARLWPKLAAWAEIDAFAARRSRETPLVILEPRTPDMG